MLLIRIALIAPCVLALRAQQPDTQTLVTNVRALLRTSHPSDEIRAQVDHLLAGQTDDLRRRAARSLTVLKGGVWDQKQEFIWSLALRADQVVADSARPLVARLSQVYAAQYPGAGPLRLRATLIGATEFEITSRNWMEQPVGFDIPLRDAADGAHQLRVELMDAGVTVTTLEQTIQIFRGLDNRKTAIDRRLGAISGHESAKASIRYPYELARAANLGRRQLNDNDFGLPFNPQSLVYDFAQSFRQSEELLQSLESGKDPLWRSKGDHQRHYWFDEAQEMMPYRVYVPSKWDGVSKLPMVLVLHGSTRDENYYFDRDGGMLAKLAEEHGFVVACPLGYRPNAGWGSNARQVQGRLSEQDAMNVLRLVSDEYGVDPTRVYLFGHSAGGAGTWHLGQKYASKWAAIAASAAPTKPDGFPFEALKGVPLMVCHGDQDDQVPVANSRNMVKAARERGLDPIYLEEPGATHITIVSVVEPKVFKFFDQHRLSR